MSGRPDPLELDRLATAIARTSRRLPRSMVRPVLQAAADGDRAAMDKVRGWASMLLRDTLADPDSSPADVNTPPRRQTSEAFERLAKLEFFRDA